MAEPNNNDRPRGRDVVAREERIRSTETIHDAVMRSGGEPFGSPYELGVPSLTERVVRYFKQRGFFGFETLEKLRPRSSRNKFTRSGAAPFVGAHVKKRG